MQTLIVRHLASANDDTANRFQLWQPDGKAADPVGLTAPDAVESGCWLLKAIHSFIKTQAPHYAQQAVQNFMIIYKQAAAADQATLKLLWNQAGLGPFHSEN